MALPSGEALLISALINVGNVTEAQSFGICAEHFRGFKDEYNWLLNYLETYGDQPSRDIFMESFSTFAFSDHADVRSAADLVHRANSKHRLREAMSSAIDLISMNQVNAAYEALVDAKPISTSANPRRLLTDLSFFDTWEHEQGIEVPYRSLQHLTGGIKPGNLWYWAARPGQGKTAHLCNIAVHAVLQGARVLFFSLEMSEMEVRARFHAQLANKFGWKNITVSAIRDRSVDMAAYKDFIQWLDGSGRLPGVLDIHTPADGQVRPSTVAARAGEYDLNLIDYVTLMRSDSGSSAVEDWRTAAMISNRLKEIALSQGVGILAASQINREGDAGVNPPKIRNLAQSDALAQDGDVVVTMRAMEGNVATHLSLEKNRHGMSSIPFFCTFNPNEGVYRNIDSDEAHMMVMETI